MNIAVAITNSTDYTPTLTAVTLHNAQWVEHQELTVGQSIANHRTIAGLLEADLPFRGSITVHYGYVSPGPHGADVVFEFNGQDIDGRPLIGAGLTQQPNNAFPHAATDVDRDGADYFLRLTVES